MGSKNSSKVFTETTFAPESIQIFEEVDEKTGIKRMRVLGQVQEADVVNKNKRIYPRDVLDEAIKDFELRMKEGRAFGQADHPMFSGSLKDTSHMTTKVWWEDNKLLAEMVVFNTPSGECVKEIVRAGGRPGFSSRGQGKGSRIKMKVDGEETEVEKIDKGFKLEAFDFVIDPSVVNARIQQIIEHAMDGGDASYKVEDHMTLAELKEKLPELYEELVSLGRKEGEASVKPALDALTTEVAGLKDTIGKLETELQAKTAEVKEQIDIIAEIIKLLQDAGYITVQGQNEPAAEPEPGGAAAGAAPEKPNPFAAANASLQKDLDAARTEVATLTKSAEESTASLQELQNQLAAKELALYLFEKTQTEVFGAILRDKLKNAKTKEDIDTGIQNYKEFAKTVSEEASLVLNGKGREPQQKDGSDSIIEDVVARAKSRANL
jgi:hypothetical protein